jgi:hypothetical protein
MQRVLNLLSKACVSKAGLFILNALVLVINIRFIAWLTCSPIPLSQIDVEVFHDFGSSLAIRLVTIGVIILERHAVLEVTGVVAKGTEEDLLTEKTHPYGIFYLVFGCLMECCFAQVDIPGKLFDAQLVNLVCVCLSYAISVISLMACVTLFYLLASTTTETH